jgi:fibronectin type 3 domain-containing protein
MVRSERVGSVHEDRRPHGRRDTGKARGGRRRIAAAAVAAVEPLETRLVMSAGPAFMVGVWQPNEVSTGSGNPFDTWAQLGINTVFGIQHNYNVNPLAPNSSFDLVGHSFANFDQYAQQDGLWEVREPNKDNLAGDATNPNLVGWLMPDEPEGNNGPSSYYSVYSRSDQMSLQDEYQTLKGVANAKPVYLNFIGGFLAYDGSQQGPFQWGSSGAYQALPSTFPTAQSYYQAASQFSDVNTEDFYPITDWPTYYGTGTGQFGAQSAWLNRTNSPHWTSGNALHRLGDYVGGKAQVAFIEAGTQKYSVNGQTVNVQPTPAQLSGEVWDAVINGAKGVVYFPELVHGGYSGDNISAEDKSQMTTEDARIASVADALGTDPITPSGQSSDVLTWSGSPTLQGSWREVNGVDYYIVENMSDTTVSNASFTLPGQAGGGTAQVVGENRSLTVGSGGTATDSFQPFATHIYQLGTQPPPPPPVETSYLSPPPNVTDTIQAENFDNGGEGLAYHDLTSTNDGGAYRPNEGVDIEATGDTGGGYDVGWTQPGEWMNYIINVPADGTYVLNTRVANPNAGGSFHLQVQNGTTWQDVSGATAVPQTGAWQTYQTVTSPDAFTLTAGQHILRLSMDAASTNGYVGNFNWLTLTSTGPTPAAPTNLSVTTLSNSSLSLSWTDNANNETSYVVQRATSQSGPYTTVATLGANTTSYTDTGLGLSATYYYEVTAVNASGSSTPASGVGTTSVPNGPFGLSVTSASSSELDLAWYDSAVNETNFIVQRATSASGPFSTVATLPANTTSYADTGLVASTTYYYNVFAENAVGDSGSTTGNGTTDSGTTGTAPAAPTGVATRTNSNSAITVSWNASAGATSYAVLRATSQGGPYSTIATLGADATSYGDTGLALSATYYYEVQAINSYGSNTSGPIAGMTSVPNGPYGLSVAAAGAGSLQLNWYDSAVNETEFVVERATSPNGTYSVVATLAANTTSWLDSGLSSGTTYYYQVFAANDVGYSGAATGSGTTT